MFAFIRWTKVSSKVVRHLTPLTSWFTPKTKVSREPVRSKRLITRHKILFESASAVSDVFSTQSVKFFGRDEMFSTCGPKEMFT